MKKTSEMIKSIFHKILFLNIFILSFNSSTFSQCCGMGSPFCGSSNAGIISPGTLRLNALYKFGYFDTYYHNNEKLVNYGPIKNMSYNYTSLILGYGLTKRLTLEHEAGYYINKVQHFNDTTQDRLAKQGYGFSNGVISVKYGAWIKPIKETEITIGFGMKYPFTRKALESNYVRLPLEVQPSSRAYGIVGQLFLKKGYSNLGLNLLLLNRIEHNFENPDKYTVGNIYISTLFISKKIIPGFIGVLQIRNEYKRTDKSGIPNDRLLSKGSEVVYLAPTFSYFMNCKLVISVFADIPVYKYYMGDANYTDGTGGQISSKYSVGISLTRDFGF